MLEGTDLMAAYQPLGGSSSLYDNSMYANLDDHNEQPKENVLKIQSTQQKQQQVQQPSQQQQVQQLPQQQIQQLPQQQVQYANDPRAAGNLYDASLFNKQYEQEIRIQSAINELKKRKEDQNYNQNQNQNQPSYFDKLFSKKKELGKILQFTLIIVLGLSIHYLIDHYLMNYISNHDMSFERQLFLRVLYPVGILFVLWNLKVFIK